MKRFICTIILIVCAIVPMAVPVRSSATTIAAIMSSEQPRYREAHRAFVKAIAAQGYKAPSTEIILLAPNSNPLSWTAEIRKLNSSRPDLIVTYGAPASLAAVREAAGIPVVSVDVYASEQPIKGVCGVSSRVSMVTLLNTLRGIRPYQRLGVLYAPREFGSQQQLDEVKKFAAKLGITVLEGSVSSGAALDSELNRLLDKCEAVFVTEGGLFGQQFERIIAKSKARKIPIASTMPDAAEKGAIVSLEINPQEQGCLAAEMAVRILEGAKTEFLPLIRPHRIDLVINMRHAREIGIEVPVAVLRSAARLIK
ncbi:MAG: ABC transporter substrate-binding protein [Desulfuromonadaceae bacterium]